MANVREIFEKGPTNIAINTTNDILRWEKIKISAHPQENENFELLEHLVKLTGGCIRSSEP